MRLERNENRGSTLSIGSVELDLDWDVPLLHRVGAEERLCGIDVFHEFDWLDVFPDERTQFKNGKCLAKFVKERCPRGKTPGGRPVDGWGGHRSRQRMGGASLEDCARGALEPLGVARRGVRDD